MTNLSMFEVFHGKQRHFQCDVIKGREMRKRARNTANTTALSEFRRLTVCAGYRFQVLCFAWATAEGGYWLLAT